MVGLDVGVLAEAAAREEPVEAARAALVFRGPLFDRRTTDAADLRISGEHADAFVGWDARLEDLDGDQSDDVVVSAMLWVPDSVRAAGSGWDDCPETGWGCRSDSDYEPDEHGGNGAVGVWFGPRQGSLAFGQADQIVRRTAVTTAFLPQWSLYAPGDLDGDGRPELAVGTSIDPTPTGRGLIA